MVHSVHMKLVRAAVALAATAALVTACGGEDGPSAQEKFCSEYRAFYDATNAGQGEDDAAVIKRMKSFAKKASELEKPSEMSKDAGAGLMILVDQFEGLSESASRDDVIALEQNLSEREGEQLDAFYLYSNRTCLSS